MKSKYKKTNKIAWIHNDISKVFGNGIKSKVKRIMDRNAYEKYDNLIFVSIDNLDKFNKIYDDMLLPHEKVIKNYIDKDRIIKLSNEEYKKIYNENEINILQVSRLVEQKGIDRLIDVHKSLIDKKIMHHIYIIGEGQMKNELLEKIKKLNCEATFTLLGAKENPYPYMKDADAVCLFSKYEGYGMVIDEAKILNKYILITNTASREAIIDYPDNSKIFDNSEEGIEKGLKEFVKNKEKILSKMCEYDYENNKIFDKIVKTIENKENKEKKE